MPSIFVSYRHSDAPGHARLLYERLAERFGEANVFKDIDSTEPGVVYEELIKATLARCDALIAVIGKDWLARGPDGASRLHDRGDWVRMELATALSREEVRVVPVLVEGAGMPSSAELPRNVESLTGIQAVVLTEDVWKLQVAQLVDNLSARLEVAAPAPPPPVGGPDARSRGDRQAKRPKAAWAVDGRWSFGRFFSHLTLELRSGERTHVLTLQAFEQEELTSPLARLDGEILRYAPIQEALSEAAFDFVGHPEFQLEGIAGTSFGKLSFSARRGELTWVRLTIDGEVAYEHGDPLYGPYTAVDPRS